MANPGTLFKDVSAGRFKPAYYFYGAEDYRIAEAEKFVARQFLPDLQRAANYRKIDARKAKVADLVAELSNLPMLGEKQVFVIGNFQSYRPKQVQQILALLTPADPNRIVIFTSPSSKMPKKTSAFFKSVSKCAEPVQFDRLTFQAVAGQISSVLKKEGIEITPEALKLFTELVDGNKGALDRELAKLVNFRQSGETVEVEDIHQVIAGHEVFGIFELADLVVAGETRKVLKMIRGLLAEGTTAVTLVTLLQQHFTSVYLVKNGKQPLGNRSFLTYKFKQQAQKYDSSRLEEIIIEIAAADARLRHQELKQEMVLEMLALTLAGENR